MTAVANSWRSYPCSMARLEIELRNYNDSSTKGAQRSHCKIFMEAKKAGMKANPTPDLKPNKVPVAKLDAVKDALAIPDIVLAQRLGVTRQTLSAWRSAGEIPTMAALALEGLLPANPPPDLKSNKVPVAQLDAVKGALAIPDIVLAQRLGVTRQTLSAWRSAGEIPTMAALALEGLLPAQPVAIVCTLA